MFPILHDLVEILFPLEFIDRLLAVDLITVADHRRLSRDSISDKKISRTLLVSILPRKGPDSFDRFLNVLRETEGQEYVAQKIHEAQKIMESEVKHERQCTVENWFTFYIYGLLIKGRFNYLYVLQVNI